MKKIEPEIIKEIFLPPKYSHKGQNGRLTIIGGSKLFHGASLWALKIASRIVDMVFYATVKENQELTKELKKKLYDFICVPQNKIGNYIDKSDAVLIGPGMVRGSKDYIGTGESGRQTRNLVKKLFFKYPQKKWIIDAGALQNIQPDWLKKLDKVIITPHHQEFRNLFGIKKQLSPAKNEVEAEILSDLIKQKAKQYGIIIILKGPVDIVCDQRKCVYNKTGNEGMTKGGTGDVLAGLIAALASKNDLFLAAKIGVYVNGLAGDELYKKMGPFYNASDLCNQIPLTLNKLIN